MLTFEWLQSHHSERSLPDHVIGTKIEVRRPHPSFRRTPDSCSAGTVPHPVPGCCRQLGLGTTEPFSSLGVPVATGMSDCYENNARPPHIVIPARAGIQSQRRGSQSTLKQWAGPFHPLMWPSQGHGDSERSPSAGSGRAPWSEEAKSVSKKWSHYTYTQEWGMM